MQSLRSVARRLGAVLALAALAYFVLASVVSVALPFIAWELVGLLLVVPVVLVLGVRAVWRRLSASRV